MLEKLLSFGLGFATGALYASYKYEHNPNDLINLAKEDANKAVEEVKKTGKKAADKVDEKIKEVKKTVNGKDAGKAEEVEVVEGEVE